MDEQLLLFNGNLTSDNIQVITITKVPNNKTNKISLFQEEDWSDEKKKE